MGKRYHCDYCDKTMVETPGIIKTHNSGLVHQKLVQQHYQRFKDPKTILAEEEVKRPCLRAQSGMCQFGAICRFSHYSVEELNELRRIVASQSQKTKDTSVQSFQEMYEKLERDKTSTTNEENETVLCDSNGITHTLPWSYNMLYESFGVNLPPSLKRMGLDDFVNADVRGWGKMVFVFLAMICKLVTVIVLLALINNVTNDGRRAVRWRGVGPRERSGTFVLSEADPSGLLASNRHLYVPDYYKDFGRRNVEYDDQFEHIHQRELSAVHELKQDVEQAEQLTNPQFEDPQLTPVKASPELVLAVAKQSQLLEKSRPPNPAQDVMEKQILRNGDYWNAAWKEEVNPDKVLRTHRKEGLHTISVKVKPGTDLYEAVKEMKKISPKLLYVINS